MVSLCAARSHRAGYGPPSASGTSVGQSNQRQLGVRKSLEASKGAELKQAIALCSGHKLERSVM